MAFQLVYKRALVLLAVLAGLLVVPSTGLAQPKQTVSSLIQKGQEMFDEQRYEESIQVLSAGLMRPGIAQAEKIQIYQLLAYNYIVLRKDEEADGAVRGLLVIDEQFVLPDSESPRFRDFFSKTRQQWEDEGKPGQIKVGQTPAESKVAIKHTSPAQVDPDMEVSLDGEIEDPGAKVAEVSLYYRTGSSGKFQKLKVKYATRKFSAQIPAEAVQPPLVEYYLEAVDEAGLPKANRGDAASPLRIAVPEPSGVLSSPWFWIPTSAVVVGVAVAIIAVVVANSSSSSTVMINVFE